MVRKKQFNLYLEGINRKSWNKREPFIDQFHTY